VCIGKLFALLIVAATIIHASFLRAALTSAGGVEGGSTKGDAASKGGRGWRAWGRRGRRRVGRRDDAPPPAADFRKQGRGSFWVRKGVGEF